MMQKFVNYEKLMEEFSYKAYTYAGNTIKLDITHVHNELPVFVMSSPELENKLDVKQKQELTEILDTAMAEVVRFKPEDRGVKEFLGWN